jgi:hypothetical protein
MAKRRHHRRTRRNPKGFKLFGMGIGTLAMLGVGGFVIWKYMLNKPTGAITTVPRSLY